MVRIVLADHHGHIAGWLDDRAQLTADIHRAAVFPNDACAVRVLRDTRRICRHALNGRGWQLQRIEGEA